jgi:hypothetical protein
MPWKCSSEKSLGIHKYSLFYKSIEIRSLTCPTYAVISCNAMVRIGVNRLWKWWSPLAIYFAGNIWPKIWLYFTSHPKFYKKTYVECKIIQISLGNYIFQTITSIFCHNISINKCLTTHLPNTIHTIAPPYIL